MATMSLLLTMSLPSRPKLSSHLAKDPSMVRQNLTKTAKLLTTIHNLHGRMPRASGRPAHHAASLTHTRITTNQKGLLAVTSGENPGSNSIPRRALSQVARRNRRPAYRSRPQPRPLTQPILANSPPQVAEPRPREPRLGFSTYLVRNLQRAKRWAKGA